MVQQIDRGQPRRNLRAGSTLQAMVDLVLKQLGGLIEQIDRYQSVGQAADHFIAAPSNRREFAVVVK